MPLKLPSLLELDSRGRLARTMHRLLDSLRPYMRAYARTPDVEMPEHHLVWVDGIDGDGPGVTILQCLKEHPELWVPAIPSDCCIVPREQLKQFLGQNAAELLTAHGESMVLNHAARLRYEAEQHQSRRTDLPHKLPQ